MATFIKFWVVMGSGLTTIPTGFPDLDPDPDPYPEKPLKTWGLQSSEGSDIHTDTVSKTVSHACL
jgi:hypothetical protein